MGEPTVALPSLRVKTGGRRVKQRPSWVGRDARSVAVLTAMLKRRVLSPHSARGYTTSGGVVTRNSATYGSRFRPRPASTGCASNQLASDQLAGRIVPASAFGMISAFVALSVETVPGVSKDGATDCDRKVAT
jgi:hypothetical protein